jgi:hypothetical protein
VESEGEGELGGGDKGTLCFVWLSCEGSRGGKGEGGGGRSIRMGGAACVYVASQQSTESSLGMHACTHSSAHTQSRNETERSECRNTYTHTLLLHTHAFPTHTQRDTQNKQKTNNNKITPSLFHTRLIKLEHSPHKLGLGP